jgi:splicing factor 1
MQELSGGNSNGPQRRIEAGPGGYDNGGYTDRNAKPWERGSAGGAAPWQRGDDQGRRDDYGSGGAAPWAGQGDNYGGYNAAAAPGASWQQAPPGAAPGYGYNGYPGYGDTSGYGPPPGLGAPPGLGSMYQQYGANGAGDVPPPPPPSGNAPPPPPGDVPPPPPGDVPPPPPPGA